MAEDESMLERILDGAEDPTDLPLALLQRITDNFSRERKIGQGGFGAVYKGVFRERIVAVKRIYVNLENIDDDDKQFGREFNSLWNTNHRNVVRFLGFCSNIHHKRIERDGSMILANVRERLFCFEYISNGSLDKHITDELRGLEWETRYEIIVGICEGLHYLHEEKKIIHMDLKPENILLHHQDDKYMVPKITDFGLSRPNEKSYTAGKVYGTQGYCAPEYSEGSKTTPACDVYSLGAIMMELVTGCMEVPNKDNVLRRWRHRWRKPPTTLQYERVTRCMEIAVRCREKKPEARPSISEIISFLSDTESTAGHTGQEISTYLDDDMVGIEPLELRSTLKLNKADNILGIVNLTNKTKACFAFNIERPSKQYIIRPDKGILPPGCLEYPVRITVQPEETVPQVTHNADKFIVRSRKVSDGLGVEGVTERMFSPEAGKVVDEVDLMVVYGPVSLKRGREPNVPVEVVCHKAIKSTSHKHCAQGQCTKQLDRRNFHPPENFSNNQPTNTTYLLRDSDRAMSATSGAIGSLLHKLGVLHNEFNLETSIEEDAEELVNMQQVLRKVSDVQQDNQLVKRWVSNVREMSYNLEDFVDGFLVNSEPDYDASGVKELTHEMCLSLEKGKTHQPIADLVKRHISKQVQDLAEKGKKYKVDNIVADASAKVAIDDLRILAIYEHEDRLVGIRSQRDEVIGLLKNDGNAKNQQLRIVSIVGLGGMGKTTLAKAVYDEFKGQYHTRAFLPVGRDADVKNILKSIMYELQKAFDAENMSVRQLIKELNELLENKRYLIVIDDIWDYSLWKLIHSAFPINCHGSRVITTTRFHDVALATCNGESAYVYNIKPLSDEHCRILFFRRTFPEKGSPDTPRKEEISKYILKKCGGMPLAINSIASLLTVGEPDSTWENVWKSLGALTEGETERKTDVDNMKQILDLSYMYLPDDLKTCLLYVCMYPEDREIQKNDLLRQWIAEGFVSRKGRLDAEDVAENNFKALINMCMIEPGEMDYNNEVLSCRVHDIILDLTRSKSSEANFIQVIDGLQDVSRPRGEIRRVSVQDKDREDGRILETIKGSLSHARSVLVYRHLILPDLLKYRYVRVLHLDDQAYSKDPLDLTGIGCFFFLKYLKISCQFSRGLKLPDQIGHLQQLETIDLEGNLKNHPSDIVTLPWLSHLTYCAPYDIMLPDGIERLKSLHTLKGVCVGKSSVENIKGLGELTNLRELEFRWDAPSESKEVASVRMNALHTSISRLSTSLRILTLDNFSVHPPDIGSCSGTLFPQGSPIRKLNLCESCFERFPEWMGQLYYLYSLIIKVTEVAECFTIVGGLPSLAHFDLCVDHRGEKEESVVISGSGAFQALKHLIVDSRKTSLTFEEGAMPKLEKIYMPFQYNIVRRLAYRRVGIHHLPAANLKAIGLTVCVMLDDWKVKGSEHWNDRAWVIYWESNHYRDKIKELARKKVPMLKRAFKLHHPSADIGIVFEDFFYSYIGDVDKENYGQDGDEEHDEDSYYDDEDFCMEDCLKEEDDESVDDEEADEAAYEVNGPQSARKVQVITRQLLQLIEAQEDSDSMSIDTDAPLIVDTTMHLAVGLEGWQDGRGSQELESSQLPLTSLVAPSPSSIHLRLALWSSRDTAPPGGLADLSRAPNQLNDEEFLELNEDDGEISINCTMQLIQLIDVQQDSGGMSIEADAPLMVDMSLHLAVRAEGQQSSHSQDL